MVEVAKMVLLRPELFVGPKRRIVERLIDHRTTAIEIAKDLKLSKDTVRAHLYKQPDNKEGKPRVSIWSIVEREAGVEKIDNLTALLEYMISTGIVAVVPIERLRD